MISFWACTDRVRTKGTLKLHSLPEDEITSPIIGSNINRIHPILLGFIGATSNSEQTFRKKKASN